MPEGVIRIDYCGVPCQARIDWFNPRLGIIDFKTCDDLTWFEVGVRSYGYGYQLAFYQAMVARVTGEKVPARLIAVEKREPYRCGVWTLSEQTLAHCQRENEAAIARLKSCEATGVFLTGYEEPRVFDAI